MKSILAALTIFTVLCFTSCQKNETSPNAPATHSPSGQVLMKVDKINIPAGVVKIIASLKRSGFDSLTTTLNVTVSDSSVINFTNVPIGTWHLILSAKNSSNITLYSGEADVAIVENIITQVNITMYPVATGVGGVNIHVSWGTSIVWTEYPSNPILKKFSSDSLTDGYQIPYVIFDNGIYKMWYTITKTGFGIGYATSADGISWNQSSQIPVLAKGSTNVWDGQLVTGGIVIRDGSTLKMYYFGRDNFGGVGRIGLATSSDGISWEKYATPVLEPTSGTWDQSGINPYSIIKKDSTYLMYYNGVNANNIASIGLAMSSDGVHWTKYVNNPIMTRTETWEGYLGIYFPSVILDQGIFKMVYSSRDDSPQQAFGYATSLDGKVWQKAAGSPIFKQSMTVNLWAHNQIAYPVFCKINSEYRLYFNGYGITGNSDWAVGLLKGK